MDTGHSGAPEGGLLLKRDPLPALLQFRSNFETLERPEESQEGECQL